MNLRLKCENPGKIEFTIVATMTAEEWEKLRDQLEKAKPEHYDGYEPGGRFVRQIDDLLSQARKTYWPRAE